VSGEIAYGLYEILDERFRTGKCANGDLRLEKLHGDCRWAEGPLYLPA
jgi:gluconolactonase